MTWELQVQNSQNDFLKNIFLPILADFHLKNCILRILNFIFYIQNSWTFHFYCFLLQNYVIQRKTHSNAFLRKFVRITFVKQVCQKLIRSARLV